MANKSISQLTSAAAVAETDLLATAIVDGGSATGYATRKHTVADVGAHIGATKTFAGLNTTSKNLVGAANEVLSNFADEYDDTATYDVGDIVVYEGGLYKCITAVSVAESFDSTKWTKGTAADFFGGGGDSGECPRVIAVESDSSGSTKTTYTSGTFNLAAGDVLLVGIMHRSALTVPAGFTLIKTTTITGAGQYLSTIYHVATTSESLSATIRQASTVRMSSYWTQLRGVTIGDAHIDYASLGSSSFTINTPLRPYILFCTNNYISGVWKVEPVDGTTVANMNDIVLYSPSGRWLSVVLNFGTSFHTKYQLTPPESDYAVMGILVTAE